MQKPLKSYTFFDSLWEYMHFGNFTDTKRISQLFYRTQKCRYVGENITYYVLLFPSINSIAFKYCFFAHGRWSSYYFNFILNGSIIVSPKLLIVSSAIELAVPVENNLPTMPSMATRLPVSFTIIPNACTTSAVAGEANVPFFNLSGSGIARKRKNGWTWHYRHTRSACLLNKNWINHRQRAFLRWRLSWNLIAFLLGWMLC